MRKNMKWIIAILVVLIVAVAAGGYMIYNQNQQIEVLKTDRVLGASAFQVGALDTTTGKLITTEDNEYSMFTPGFYKLEGLDIDLAKETTFTYKLFYYNEDKEYIACSNYFDTDYVAPSSSALANAKYFRLMINTDEVKVTSKTMATILKDVTVTVAK